MKHDMKLRTVFALWFVCLGSLLYGQTDSVSTEVIPDDTVYTMDAVDNMASFPGGDAALDRYIDSKLSFSDRAYKYAKSGTVIIGFTVEKDGKLSNIRCLHRRRVGYGVEESCMKVFREMPAWKPAQIGDDYVRVRSDKSIRLNL
ncbi:MAG: hypothetical protein JJ975_06675 [Bacteroidia bacterium]|nr:hypothetical protein [Bacteroidia bacterium]